MTLQQYIDKLQNMADSYKDMEIKIQAPNGLMFDPKVKFLYKELGDFSRDNIDHLVVSY